MYILATDVYRCTDQPDLWFSLVSSAYTFLYLILNILYNIFCFEWPRSLTGLFYYYSTSTEKQSGCKAKIIQADFTGGAEIYPNIEEGLKDLDIGILGNYIQ